MPRGHTTIKRFSRYRTVVGASSQLTWSLRRLRHLFEVSAAAFMSMLHGLLIRLTDDGNVYRHSGFG